MASAAPAAHRIEVPGWRPATVNELTKRSRHWGAAARLKRRDRRVVAWHAALAGTPRATARRRVSLSIRQPRGRPDPDGLWKSVLDALVAAGLLVDDSARYCEMGPAAVAPGPLGTTIELEDLP